jgi:hypothetical protein
LGRYAEAVTEFSEGLKDQPDYAWAFLKRGCAEVLLGQTDAALADQQAGLGLLRRFADDSQASQYDIQRATEVESELRLAADGEQATDAKALCAGYWREQEGRARSALLPAQLQWVQTIEQRPSALRRATSLARAVPGYLWWVIIVAVTLAVGGRLKRPREPGEWK